MSVIFSEQICFTDGNPWIYYLNSMSVSCRKAFTMLLHSTALLTIPYVFSILPHFTRAVHLVKMICNSIFLNLIEYLKLFLYKISYYCRNFEEYYGKVRDDDVFYLHINWKDFWGIFLCIWREYWRTENVGCVFKTSNPHTLMHWNIHKPDYTRR